MLGMRVTIINHLEATHAQQIRADMHKDEKKTVYAFEEVRSFAVLRSTKMLVAWQYCR